MDIITSNGHFGSSMGLQSNCNQRCSCYISLTQLIDRERLWMNARRNVRKLALCILMMMSCRPAFAATTIVPGGEILKVRTVTPLPMPFFILDLRVVDINGMEFQGSCLLAGGEGFAWLDPDGRDLVLADCYRKAFDQLDKSVADGSAHPAKKQIAQSAKWFMSLENLKKVAPTAYKRLRDFEVQQQEAKEKAKKPVIHSLQ